MQFIKNKKALIIAAAAIAFIILVTILSSTGGRLGGSVTVEVIVAPTDSTLTVDGEPAEPGQISLSTGEHTLKATREFFGEASKTVNTDDLDTGQPIYLALDPDTPEGEQYLADNPDEQLLRERAFGQEFSDTSQSILERYPVTTDLPYVTVDYRIDYEVTESKDVNFTVTLYPVATQPGSDLYKQQLEGFKQSALNYLAGKGVDTETANITFSPDPGD